MSLFGDDLITISLYYIYKDTKYGGSQLIILEDEKAKGMMESEDEEEQKKVKVLNTQWKGLTWKEQNELVKKSEKSNATTGMPDLDWAAYQDMRVKFCLKSWDHKQNDTDANPMLLTEEVIDSLQSSVVKALLDRYDNVTSVEKEDLEK